MQIGMISWGLKIWNATKKRNEKHEGNNQSKAKLGNAKKNNATDDDVLQRKAKLRIFTEIF